MFQHGTVFVILCLFTIYFYCYYHLGIASVFGQWRLFTRIW